MSGRPCPILVTERLTLRAHRIEDHPESLAFWSDPEVVRHLGGRPHTAEEVWRRLLAYAGLWSLRGFGFWLIEETVSGAFVGEGGLLDYHRGLGPDFDLDPEAGWGLFPWAQGRGYAFEAMSAVLAWAETTLQARRTVCIIAPENGPSLRLAARLGYAEIDQVNYRGAVVRLARQAGAPSA